MSHATHCIPYNSDCSVCNPAASPPSLDAPAEIEKLAEAVHEAYLKTCARLGWSVKPENQVPYAELSDDSKELDRASVRAVLQAMGEREAK